MEPDIIMSLIIFVVALILLIYTIYIIVKEDKWEEEELFAITVVDHYMFKEGDEIRYLVSEQMVHLKIIEINGNTITAKRIENGNHSS